MGPMNTETEITMTKKELLSLLFKLEREDSARALIRLGEDGKEYYIRAIPDTPDNSFWMLHPIERVIYNLWLAFEKE